MCVEKLDTDKVTGALRRSSSQEQLGGIEATSVKLSLLGTAWRQCPQDVPASTWCVGDLEAQRCPRLNQFPNWV